MLDQRSDRFPTISSKVEFKAEYGLWLSQNGRIEPIMCGRGHDSLATDIEVVHGGKEPEIVNVCDQCKYEWEMSHD